MNVLAKLFHPAHTPRTPISGISRSKPPSRTSGSSESRMDEEADGRQEWSRKRWCVQCSLLGDNELASIVLSVAQYAQTLHMLTQSSPTQRILPLISRHWSTAGQTATSRDYQWFNRVEMHCMNEEVWIACSGVAPLGHREKGNRLPLKARKFIAPMRESAAAKRICHLHCVTHSRQVFTTACAPR